MSLMFLSKNLLFRTHGSQETCKKNVGRNIQISWVKSSHSYLNLSSYISAPRHKFKNLVGRFHRIHLMNPHAKFQPPSS